MVKGLEVVKRELENVDCEMWVGGLDWTWEAVVQDPVVLSFSKVTDMGERHCTNRGETPSSPRLLIPFSFSLNTARMPLCVTFGHPVKWKNSRF